MQDFSFFHSQLGEMVGLARGDDIVQFRGIPFANIPDRFRQCTLAEELPHEPFDARQPGPICPQPSCCPYPSFFVGPLPADYPRLQEPPAAEFDCLNLCITTPRALLTTNTTTKVPVMIFIHGGALVGGSQSIQLSGREIYDGTNLVRSSITPTDNSPARPIIFVTINYRMGPLGFLASDELAAMNESNGEAMCNYGLHDQHRAIEWVSRFIVPFGGDPERITIQGTSAGGSSCHYQTIFRERRFARAILASGTMIGIGPKYMEDHQGIFRAYLNKFGGTGESGTHPIQLLRQVNVTDLVVPVVPGIYNPVIEYDWVPGATMNGIKDVVAETAEGQQRPPPDLMIGACEFEQDLTEILLMDLVTGQPLRDDMMLQSVLDVFTANGMLIDQPNFPFNFPEVIREYGLAEALERPSRAKSEWAALMADVAFRLAPVYIGLMHEKSRVFVYEIHAKNPFTAWKPSCDKAGHGVNDLIMFDVAEDLVPREKLAGWRGAVRDMRGKWLDFCYGATPWREVGREIRERGTQIGPVYKFEDGGKGGEMETVEEVVGAKVASRWVSVLKTSRGMEEL